MTDQMLCTFERQTLKIIHSPIQDKECWHPRWNSEVYNLYKDLNILHDIKIQRLGWIGHFVRMKDEKIPKKTLNVKFHNSRPRGKTNNKMGGCHRRDTSQILGNQGQKRRAEDKEE
jgi:hypothetical protein